MSEKYQKTNRGFSMGQGRGPMRGVIGAVEKPKDFKGSLKTLLKYLKPYRASIVLVIALAIASTVFTILSPRILGNMTNEIVAGFMEKNLAQIPGLSFINYHKIAQLARILLALYFFSALFSYLQRWTMSGVAQEVSFNLRQDISKKINRLPLSYFDRQSHGEVLSRITNDVDTASQSLQQTLTQMITALSTLLGILVMMFLISWPLTLVALVILPLSFFLIKFLVKKTQRYFLRQQKYLGEINGQVEEMFSGHLIVKAYGGEEKSLQRFKSLNSSLERSAWKSQFFSGLLMPIVNFIGNLSYVGVAVLGAYLVLQGRLRIGDIQAFFQYMNQFNQPITQTANIANIMQAMVAAAERVFEFLAEPEELSDAKLKTTIPEIKGAIEFDKVNFSYKQGKPVIRDFSAKIKPGQRVAIVGPTGAGKTTIVNLLMRFYELDSGSIKVDGFDTEKLQRNYLRSLFGMVLQDTWLFNGTIRDNISYGRSEVSQAEVSAVAKAVQIDHLIKTLAAGCDTEINEEADNISQGEKQLLTIARAMLVDAPILILDEATSSVDTRTEVLIQEAMEKLMQGRTSFIIAHRLSTIKNADLILVMNAGSIVEQGHHQELLDQNGFYASLYNSQFATI